MRMVINRWHKSVKYKVIATSVDNLEMEAEKAMSSNKKRKDRNISSNERIETQETEYVGVSWHKGDQRWAAKIKIDKKQKHLGCFESDYDAAMAYDEEARKHGKSVNFPINPTDVQAKKPQKLSADERIETQETDYVGVSWDKRDQQWRAQIRIDDSRKHLGCFESDYDAAMRYDEEARKHGKPVNFKSSDEEAQATKINKPRKLYAEERIESNETEYVGVSWDKGNQRWKASISINGRRKHLGRFDSDYDAAMAYDEEARQQGKSVNLPINPADVQAKKPRKRNDNSDKEAQATKRNKPRKLCADERIESNETEYVGVSWDKGSQRWHAQIRIDGSPKHLGYFDNDYDAAMAYDEESRKQGKPVNVPIHPTDIQAEKRKKS